MSASVLSLVPRHINDDSLRSLLALEAARSDLARMRADSAERICEGYRVEANRLVAALAAMTAERDRLAAAHNALASAIDVPRDAAPTAAVPPPTIDTWSPG